MADQHEYDAELRNFSKMGNCYWGEIHGDSKGRFRDGHFIKTSQVVSRSGDIVSTRNTRYKLIWP